MAPKEVTLYLFGDQTCNVGPLLKELMLGSRHINPLVNDFLRGSYDALRAELYRLPPQERNCLPRFTCVEDLILWASRSPDASHRCVPLSMALTCMYQLAAFIGYVSPHPLSPSHFRATTSNSSWSTCKDREAEM